MPGSPRTPLGSMRARMSNPGLVLHSPPEVARVFD